MNEQLMQNQLLCLIRQWGDLGVFAAMFLESSIIPIPSELIIIGAGAVGIPLRSIIIFGGIGSTLGGLVGYTIGARAALPVILRFGKYIFIKPHHLEKAEAFAKKYGAWGVLLGRLTPVVPFKVFSIASGIARTPVVIFATFTLIGVLPRIYLLAMFGAVIMKYQKLALAGVLALVAAFVLVIYIRKRRKAGKAAVS
jgi:membrane protein DedA with SNARE-associated domain